MKKLKYIVSWIAISSLLLLVHTGRAQNLNNTSGTIVLKNVTVIDGTGSPPKPDQVVVVNNGIIKSVNPLNTWEPSDRVNTIDLDGRFIIPGLINGHVHLTAFRGDLPSLLRDLLYQGVTAVRDLGGDARSLSVLARDARLGVIESPDIYYAATFFGPQFTNDPRVRFSSMGYDPGTAPWAQEITEETDLSLAEARARGTGATGLKLYASLDSTTMRYIVAEGHRQGMEVWPHATVFPTSPSEVLETGVDGMEHIGLLRAENHEGTLPETWSEGFNEWLPAQAKSEGNPDSGKFIQLFKKIASRGTHVGTTLHVPHRLANENDLEPGWSPRTGIKQEHWVCKATKALQNAGVSLVAGTDLDGSVPIQEEMKLLVDCGLTPIEAIRSATLEPAKAIGIEENHGSLEPGKVADIVVLDSDPTKNINNTSKIYRLMKSGHWYDP